MLKQYVVISKIKMWIKKMNLNLLYLTEMLINTLIQQSWKQNS